MIDWLREWWVILLLGVFSASVFVLALLVPVERARECQEACGELVYIERRGDVCECIDVEADEIDYRRAVH